MIIETLLLPSQIVLPSFTEGITGILDKPCYRFGNGVEIEKKPFATTTGENSKVIRGRGLVLNLPQVVNKHPTKVVSVHFLPETSLAQRANDPTLVNELEKHKIAIDCLLGFLALANALKFSEITIEEIENYDDFYLYALTSSQFAAFLRSRCQFRGNAGGSEVWIKKSEFISPENMAHIGKQALNFIEKLQQKSKNPL